MSLNKISRRQAVKTLVSIRRRSASVAAAFISSMSARVKLSGFLENLGEESGLSFVVTRPPLPSDMYLWVPFVNRPATFFSGSAADLPDDLHALAQAEGDSLLVIRFVDGDILGLRFTGKPN